MKQKERVMNSERAGYIEGYLSLIVNTVLFALKFWVGIITGSIALTADAWHTLSDSISSVIVIVAAKFSKKKPDHNHPFGHGRIENIASLSIAFFLVFIAFEFIKTSILSLESRESVEYGTWAIIVVIFSIVAKELLAQYAFYLSRKSGSLTVKADAWHHRSDAFSSLIVLLGILFAQQFWWIDSVLGIFVSLMLLYVAYGIARESTTKLLGEKPDDELVESIKATILESYPEDLNPSHFRYHNYVKHKELTFRIKLDKALNIESSHRIATDIERKIQQKYGVVSTIRIEPKEECRQSAEKG